MMTVATYRKITPANTGPKLQQLVFLILVVAILVSLAGCASAPPMLLPPATSTYQLGAGDQVRVITYDEAQLTNTFTVEQDGTIAFPLIGTVQANGLSATELAASIANSLKFAKLLSTPSVSVEVVQYRPISVLGEVNKPGQYSYEPGMTTLDAVALAGGFTYRAVTNSATDWRAGVEGSITPGSVLEPGDVLTISERYF